MSMLLLLMAFLMNLRLISCLDVFKFKCKEPGCSTVEVTFFSALMNSTLHLRKAYYIFPDRANNCYYQVDPSIKTEWVIVSISICQKKLRGYLYTLSEGYEIVSENGKSILKLSRYDSNPLSFWEFAKEDLILQQALPSLPEDVTSNFTGPAWGGNLNAAVFLDHTYSTVYGRDEVEIERNISHIFIITNAYWSQFNIVIYLRKIYYFFEEHFFLGMPKGRETWRAFRNWTEDRSEKFSIYDLQVLIIPYYLPDSQGFAILGGLCNASTHINTRALMITHSANPTLSAVILAHELGHALCQSHSFLYKTKNCRTSSNWDILFATKNISYSGNAANFGWTDCSFRATQICLETIDFYCLRKEIKINRVISVCGNGIIEPGEQCECLEDWCSKCCHFCMLVSGARCGSGPCCNRKTCQIFSIYDDISCRNARDHCDIEERCDGQSEFCPNDVYKQDGLMCIGKKGYPGYCYQGFCGNHEDACFQLFDVAKNSRRKCYEKNHFNVTEGSNCGPLHFDQRDLPRPCDLQDIYCGKLMCPNNLMSENVAIGLKVIIPVAVHTVHDRQCSSMIRYHSSYQTLRKDLTFVPNGARCDEKDGISFMCVNQKCVPVAEISGKKPCPNNCSDVGVCDNEGKCHCHYPTTSTDCSDYHDMTTLDIFLILLITLCVVGVFLAFLSTPKGRSFFGLSENSLSLGHRGLKTLVKLTGFHNETISQRSLLPSSSTVGKVTVGTTETEVVGIKGSKT